MTAAVDARRRERVAEPMTQDQAVTVLTRMRANRTGTANVAIAAERRALDIAIAALNAYRDAKR